MIVRKFENIIYSLSDAKITPLTSKKKLGDEINRFSTISATVDGNGYLSSVIHQEGRSFAPPDPSSFRLRPCGFAIVVYSVYLRIQRNIS